MAVSNQLSLLEAKDKFVDDLKQKGRAHATVLAYGNDIEQLATFARTLNKFQVADVGTDDIEAFKTSLKSQDYTAKSISRKINSIKSLYRFLDQKKLIGDNPAQQVSHPKYEVSPPRILSKLEYRALRDACRDDLRLSAIIELLLQTGIRIGELAGLKLDDVNLNRKILIIKPYESHEGRTIPLTQAAVKSLEAYLKIRPKTKEDTLFITKTGNSFLVRNIRTAIDRYYKLAGIKNAKVNDLRHTFIIEQLSSGVPLTYLSKVVGHKRISTTEKYMKLIENQSEKDSVKIEEL